MKAGFVSAAVSSSSADADYAIVAVNEIVATSARLGSAMYIANIQFHLSQQRYERLGIRLSTMSFPNNKPVQVFDKQQVQREDMFCLLAFGSGR